MQQQINLYTLLPQKTIKRFGLEAILVLYGIFVIGLLINYAFLLMQKNDLLDQLQNLNVQLIQEKKALGDILEKYPLINPDDLEGSLSKLQVNLSSKAKLVQALASPAKFSDYLNALANTDISGAWLTQIIINDNGLKMELRGQSSNQEKVHVYYANLKKQTFFSRMDLELAVISRSPEESQLPTAVSFTITGNANNEL